MIRVLVVDDHPVVRMGLTGLLDLEDDIEVTGEAADGEEAVLLAGTQSPDVVLMDLQMPRLDGAGATARIVAQFPQIQVLVLTTFDTDDDILRAVEAGARGYLLKDTARVQLVDAVRAAARGETVLAPPVAARLVTRLRTSAGSAGTGGSAGSTGSEPQNPLTPREVEVLRAVAQGLSNAEIGRSLFIGEATVKTHLLRVFAKLGVDDRTRAVTAAMERGILPPPSRSA